ncbi:adenylate cyclase [Tistlia consotensis]|uniref:Adenylate cyclase n=1 Tax=Tistlia consotensis USBA 355 TaxID=560819 RepID=A0A1Y6BHF8_9PROT|nr:adenylate/guanylate cyclase domain-containing protein [Tistlia consotensis]SMF09298.1 adenylate cyclase [Tistlia consotensis USBA 355]SNR34668.1 adenylate cyclase [Tistlia consotensis]
MVSRELSPARTWRLPRRIFARDVERLRLPQRVRAAIQTQEDRTERLIGWLQLGIVLLFGTLYAISPKTAPHSMQIQPVPIALGIYLTLTLVRIAWAYAGRLPNWAVALSSVVDMALLMALIWWFHIQYSQPPSFYLKAPTLLYVFIFISLRALRFDARFVVWSGLVAAVGWLLMVAYVIYADPHDSMITRNYVEYLTSNSILIGAEFDKIISILVVSIVLGVALTRGRNLLVRSVSEGMAAQELSRFFAPQIAQRIKGAEQAIEAGSAEVCDAAILNLDLRGFTRLAETESPQAVLALLGEYQALVVPIVQAHGGSIDKYLGDGIMASFGATQQSAAYAAEALAALEAVIAEAERWRGEREAAGRPAPRVNGAVATGPVLFGAVGTDKRLEITVIGDAVNLSAKLEKHNKRVGSLALATAEAYELACSQGFERRPAHRPLPGEAVAGVGQPVDLVQLS